MRGVPTKSSERKYLRAIRAMDAARKAIMDLTDARTESDDQRLTLATKLREYADYLENAKWWRVNP